MRLLCASSTMRRSGRKVLGLVRPCFFRFCHILSVYLFDPPEFGLGFIDCLYHHVSSSMFYRIIHMRRFQTENT